MFNKGSNQKRLNFTAKLADLARYRSVELEIKRLRKKKAKMTQVLPKQDLKLSKKHKIFSKFLSMKASEMAYPIGREQAYCFAQLFIHALAQEIDVIKSEITTKEFCDCGTLLPESIFVGEAFMDLVRTTHPRLNKKKYK